MLARVITRLVSWAVGVFYDVERTGPPLGGGPVLVTANHPNALMDPLVILRTGGRSTRPLAKAPLFEHALVGTVLKGLGGLPVYRRQDDPSLTHLNERTFDAAIDALHRGEAVQIYPEGQSHSEPSLAPLRTGAARIALLAEERRGWGLGLRVQPVGLTYTRKHMFRGRVVAAFGEPFVVAEYRPLYERDAREGVRALTEELRRRLEALTLNLERADDAELVEVAERLYASGKRWTRPRERVPLAERLPRLQRFAEGVRWLRSTDPDQLARLDDDVRRYLRLLTLLGASEGDVPPRYRLSSVVRWVVRQSLLLVLVLPAALAGMVVWAAPYFGTRYGAPRFRPELDQIATFKMGVAVVAFPLWLVLLSGAAFLLGGPWAAALTVGGLPVLGLAAVAWRERQSRVREDVRVFLRAVRHRRGRDRLAEQRASLVAEFDELWERWRRSEAFAAVEERPGSGGP